MDLKLLPHSRERKDNMASYDFFSYPISDAYPLFRENINVNNLRTYLEKNRKDATELIKSISLDFEAKVKGDGGASHVIDEYLDQGMSMSMILQIFFISKYGKPDKKDDNKKGKKKKNKEKIMSPYRYFMAKYYPQGLANKEGDNPARKFYKNEEVFNKHFKRLKSIETIPFIRTLLFKNSFGDVMMEKYILEHLLEKYTNNFTSDDKMLIIDPHPDLVEWLCREFPQNEYNIRFLFYLEELCELYKREYKNFEFISIDSINNESRSLNFTHAVLFGNQDNCESLNGLLCKLKVLLAKDARIDCIVPNSWIDNDSTHLRKNVCDTMDLKNVYILPTKVFTSKNKKHIYIHASNGKTELSNEIVFNKIHFEKKACTSNSVEGTLFKEPWGLKIPASDFLGITIKLNRNTINGLFEYKRPKVETGEKRESGKFFYITNEIMFWYSWKNGRGSIMYYDIPEKKNTGTKKLQRGKKQFEVAITAKSEEKMIDNFTERLLYVKLKDKKIAILLDKIRDDIKKNYIDKEEGKAELSMKSYWFIRRDVLKDKRYYDTEMCIRLFNSSIISGITSNDNINAQDIINEIKMITHEKEMDKIVSYLRQINIIIREAKDEGLYLHENVNDYIIKYNKKRRGIRDVRKALTKISYTRKEVVIIYDFLRTNYLETGKSIYLGALISFFTGLYDSEIVAIFEDDICAISGLKKTHQFLIYSEYRDGQILPIPVKKKDRYRKIPIVRELDELIDIHLKKRKKDFQNIHDNELLYLPILYDKIGNTLKGLEPNEIKKVKEEAEKKLNLDPKEGFGNMGGKDKPLDFNEYNRDRFRTNFEYQLIETNGGEKHEIDYLLGKAQTNTFAKHYCDPRNDFYQIKLKKEMERFSSICGRMDMKESPKFIKSMEIKSTHKIIIREDAKKSALRIKAYSNDDETKITVNEDCGVDITIDTVEEER